MGNSEIAGAPLLAKLAMGHYAFPWQAFPKEKRGKMERSGFSVQFLPHGENANEFTVNITRSEWHDDMRCLNVTQVARRTVSMADQSAVPDNNLWILDAIPLIREVMHQTLVPRDFTSIRKTDARPAGDSGTLNNWGGA
jgi:hypothetical protein